MGMFLASLAVVLAFVIGAWIKLAPSPEERRLAALREKACRRGLKIRWVTRAEREALGASCALTWYGFSLASGFPENEIPATATAVLRDGRWQWAEGDRFGIPAAIPSGVQALRIGDGLVQVAWDERDEAVLDSLIPWLEDQAVRLTSLTGAGQPPP